MPPSLFRPSSPRSLKKALIYDISDLFQFHLILALRLLAWQFGQQRDPTIRKEVGGVAMLLLIRIM
jgi:hypothetical protein